MQPGDSGAIVIDSLTHEVYGHVVGSNPLGEVYVSPYIEILRQISLAFPRQLVSFSDEFEYTEDFLARNDVSSNVNKAVHFLSGFRVIDHGDEVAASVASRSVSPSAASSTPWHGKTGPLSWITSLPRAAPSLRGPGSPVVPSTSSARPSSELFISPEHHDRLECLDGMAHWEDLEIKIGLELARPIILADTMRRLRLDWRPWDPKDSIRRDPAIVTVDIVGIATMRVRLPSRTPVTLTDVFVIRPRAAEARVSLFLDIETARMVKSSAPVSPRPLTASPLLAPQELAPQEPQSSHLGGGIATQRRSIQRHQQSSQASTPSYSHYSSGFASPGNVGLFEGSTEITPYVDQLLVAIRGLSAEDIDAESASADSEGTESDRNAPKD